MFLLEGAPDLFRIIGYFLSRKYGLGAQYKSNLLLQSNPGMWPSGREQLVQLWSNRSSPLLCFQEQGRPRKKLP